MSLRPRLNHPSLIQMAIRFKKSILSSGYRSETIQDITNMLDWMHNYLESKKFEIDELALIEEQLEVMELFLYQLWISPPYNEILNLPRQLSNDQQSLIYKLIERAKKESRHLKIAYSVAA